MINPAGGAGNAQQLYDDVVASMLLQSDIEAEVVVTQRQYHASDVVAAAPLGAFDCIVAVGGDGLLSESESFPLYMTSLILDVDELCASFICVVCSSARHYEAT